MSSIGSSRHLVFRAAPLDERALSLPRTAAVKSIGIQDIAFDDLYLAVEGGEILAQAAREIIEDGHAIAGPQQVRDDVRADEAGAPCDQHRARH